VTSNCYEFGFVPQDAVARGRQFIHPSMTISREERVRLWADGSFSESLAAQFSGLLPGPDKAESGSLRWGSADGICIDVLLAQERVIEVRLSIRLSVPCIGFLSDFSLLANRMQWVGVMPDGRIFRPCVRRFLAEMRHARTTRWDLGAPGCFPPRRLLRRG
jgi:hypothetical protein